MYLLLTAQVTTLCHCRVALQNKHNLEIERERAHNGGLSVCRSAKVATHSRVCEKLAPYSRQKRGGSRLPTSCAAAQPTHLQFPNGPRAKTCSAAAAVCSCPPLVFFLAWYFALSFFFNSLKGETRAARHQLPNAFCRLCSVYIVAAAGWQASAQVSSEFCSVILLTWVLSLCFTANFHVMNFTQSGLPSFREHLRRDLRLAQRSLLAVS